MLFNRLILALAGLSAVADAHNSARNFRAYKRDSILEVTLASSPSGNAAELVATIKNNGANDLNLLKFGTILDEELPLQKVVVSNEAGSEVAFKGIHPSIQYAALEPRHFQLLKAGDSVQTTVYAAAVHNFPASGTYSFEAQGSIPVAAVESAQLSGPAVSFESNKISVFVDADEAALSLTGSPFQERTNIQSGCNETELAASTTALDNCQNLALSAAADAVDPSSNLFVEFFGTNSTDTRQIVSDRLTAVAEECSTTDSGVTRYFCYDYYSICEIDGPLNAYTLWDMDTTVMCPLFYDTLPPLPGDCGRQGQATTTIHELTHAEGVYSPHTNDWAYGYNETVALTPERALANADSYSLYATAVYLRCQGGVQIQ